MLTKPTRKTLVFACVLAAAASLVACAGAGGPAAQLAPTATLAPIISMTPRFTATPLMSRTPLPTATFTPSVTPIPPTPTITLTPTDVPPVMGRVISAQRVNVREGPGTAFNQVTALDPGTQVEVLALSDDGDWYNVQIDEQTSGWISAVLLDVDATATPLPTFTPTVDQTAIAQGTPTAILGGAPVSPTPAPIGDATSIAAGANAGTPVIDLNAFNMTATALVGSITGNATATAIQNGAVSSTSSAPLGGPTGGPIGGPTPTLGSGSGERGQSSAQSGVDVLAYCDNLSLGLPAPRNLEAGAVIDIYWSWFARTQEQIRDHNENVIYEVAIDGTPLTNWRLYAAPLVQQQDNNWYQYWYVPFGPLTSGPHVITYRVTWREAITDGYAQFGPGTSTVEESGRCNFTVQ